MPVSAGGKCWASCTRMRYCESTTRRSSSAARVSVQCEKSITPVFCQ